MWTYYAHHFESPCVFTKCIIHKTIISFVNLDFRDGKVLKRIIQCCGLNGGVFWLSIIMFEYVLLPSLKYLLISILGQSTVASTVWSWSLPVLSWTFSALWVLPLFLLSKIVNTLWFQVFFTNIQIYNIILYLDGITPRFDFLGHCRLGVLV